MAWYLRDDRIRNLELLNVELPLGLNFDIFLRVRCFQQFSDSHFVDWLCVGQFFAALELVMVDVARIWNVVDWGHWFQHFVRGCCWEAQSLFACWFVHFAVFAQLWRPEHAGQARAALLSRRFIFVRLSEEFRSRWIASTSFFPLKFLLHEGLQCTLWLRWHLIDAAALALCSAKLLRLN